MLSSASVLAATAVFAACTRTSGTSRQDPGAPTRTPTNTPIPNSIEIRDNGWVPNSLTVPAGTFVTWRNVGTLTHQVTSGTGCAPFPTPAFDSGPIAPGGTWVVQFTGTGTWTYIDPPCCATMGNGNVVVQ